MSDLTKFSVVAFPWGREVVSVTELVAFAVRAEELGFHSVNVPMVSVSFSDDDLFATFPNHHILDTIVLMTAMLQATRSIRICSDGFPLSLLPPYHWAKTIATWDHMSNGRVIAGFCVGYGKQMFDAYGANMRERGRRCDEQLEIITRLWTEPSVTYAGKHYQIAELTCEPKPVQKPHPPIWWAGGEKSIPRAARHAQCLDLFLPTLEEIRTLGPKLRQACDRAGTSTELGTWVYAHVTEGETWSADDIDRHFAGYYFSNKPALPREVAVAGNPGQCVTKLREYQALGVTRFVLDFQNHGVDSVSSSLAQMERFARDVTPLL